MGDWFDEAVLDRETGLVWETTPDTTLTDWVTAAKNCRGRIIGNRLGWRLPTFEELTTLVDPTQSLPALPPGHPFVVHPRDSFWTATTREADPTRAYVVHIESSGIGSQSKITSNSNSGWCVRGGSNPIPPF